MGAEITAAFLAATIAFILTILLGPRIVELFEMMGRATLQVPMALRSTLVNWPKVWEHL